MKNLQLELTSYCISKCPACMLQRLPYWNDSVTSLDFDKFSKHTQTFLSKLSAIGLCGTVGEITYYEKLTEMIEFIYACNPNIEMYITTIAQIDDVQFWDKLISKIKLFPKDNVKVLIPIDGLKDTYDKYRINCSFDVVIKNAVYLIKNDINVFWKFIKFPYNVHQVSTCRSLSKSLGFAGFNTRVAWEYTSTDYECIHVDKPNFVSAKHICSYDNLLLTCDGYLWPCCYISATYYYHYKELFNIGLKQPEFSVYNHSIEDILLSTKWNDMMNKILQSYCNQRLCSIMRD